MTTMSDDERATMTAHVAYWSGLMGAGRVIGFGPVAGGYGIGIVLAQDLADAEAMRADDPAIRSPHGLRVAVAPEPVAHHAHEAGLDQQGGPRARPLPLDRVHHLLPRGREGE